MKQVTRDQQRVQIDKNESEQPPEVVVTGATFNAALKTGDQSHLNAAKSRAKEHVMSQDPARISQAVRFLHDYNGAILDSDTPFVLKLNATQTKSLNEGLLALVEKPVEPANHETKIDQIMTEASESIDEAFYGPNSDHPSRSTILDLERLLRLGILETEGSADEIIETALAALAKVAPNSHKRAVQSIGTQSHVSFEESLDQMNVEMHKQWAAEDAAGSNLTASSATNKDVGGKKPASKNGPLFLQFHS